jgi:hypothetical protein
MGASLGAATGPRRQSLGWPHRRSWKATLRIIRCCNLFETQRSFYKRIYSVMLIDILLMFLS